MFDLLNGLYKLPATITFKVPSRQVSLYMEHKKDNILAVKNRYGVESILFEQIDDQENPQLVA